ncbi:hypothetical protein CkaCkLH20_04590 [Colletotrichum karsti]|uniref:Uncharacterized protein n=1 Tax=Colletotrichum karsti TaxID=1095194 RepID=A0A9P6I853_9PEZI|nr:uncharacterized protein CkaCkLH20_04590 [Colletotrichum karsti]KAF9878014.1 hypothetical protein CkaCkLH20_04590 [Colletotrichum karsti]
MSPFTLESEKTQRLQSLVSKLTPVPTIHISPQVPVAVPVIIAVATIIATATTTTSSSTGHVLIKSWRPAAASQPASPPRGLARPRARMQSKFH